MTKGKAELATKKIDYRKGNKSKSINGKERQGKNEFKKA